MSRRSTRLEDASDRFSSRGQMTEQGESAMTTEANTIEAKLERSGPGGCPVFHGFDALDERFMQDPLTLMARARNEAPVFYMPEYEMYAVTRYADLEMILRDDELFSARPMAGVVPPRPEEYADQLPGGWNFEPTFFALSTDDHRRIRKLAQQGFTPRLARSREPAIREVAHGRVDLATEFGHKIPPMVVGPIFGVPREEGPQLHGWAIQAIHMISNQKISHETLLEYAEAQSRFRERIVALVEERRRNPRDENDLLTALINATTDEGDPQLTDDELVTVVTIALIAGSETTATGINRTVQLLLLRDQWQRLVDDPETAPAIVEEGLRFWGPNHGILRQATRDTEIDGVAIPAGSLLWLAQISANQDESMFERACEFDPTRADAKNHLAFGLATHFCLGAPLARMEIKVAIQVLAERIPGLRLVSGDLKQVPSMVVPAILSGLIAEWDV